MDNLLSYTNILLFVLLLILTALGAMIEERLDRIIELLEKNSKKGKK